MKTYKNSPLKKTPVTVMIIILIVFSWFTANSQDFTKMVDKTYEVDKGSNLVIKNKFGDVKCLAWDQNSVSIKVTIKAEASNQEKANRIFEKIQVDLSGDRNLVQGVTTVGNINNADFSIDYDIRMPRWINLDLNNQFGDIFIDETDGISKIRLEYGAMEANKLNGLKTSLEIKFSDVETGYMKEADVNIEYSELDLKETGNLKLYSRFSENTLGKLAKLNLDSQYDEIDVENSGEVISVSRFSELDIEKISGDFDFDIEYGEVSIGYVAPGFKTGKVRNTFADAELEFDPKASLNLEAELQFGDLTYPKASSMNHEVVGYTTNIYKGKIGATSGISSQLNIISKNSNVQIGFTD